MKVTFTSAARLGWGTVVLLFSLGAPAQARDNNYEAQLIWATTNSVSPDPKHKPVEADVRRKLEELPLKWKNFFEVSRQTFGVPVGGTKKVRISEKCAIEVRVPGEKKVEVLLFDKKGDVVRKQTQPLPKGEILVLAGNAPDATAWLVVLKRIE